MRGTMRSRPSGSRSSASSAVCERVARVLVGPQQQHGDVDAGVGVEQLAARAGGQRRASFAHERARFAFPPTSASAWRTTSAAAGFAARATAARRARAQRGARAVHERAVQRRDVAPIRATRRQRSHVRSSRAGRCRRVDMRIEPRRAHAAAARRRAARARRRAPWPPTIGRGPPTSVQNARDDLGEPVARCTGGAGGPRSRRAAAGRAARRGGLCSRPSTSGVSSRWLSSSECQRITAGPVPCSR